MTNHYSLITVGIICSLIYTVLPLPDGSVFSIDFMLLLFVCWCFLNPKSPPTLWFAWSLGLAQDLLLGSVLGEHAFALVVSAYMALVLLQRMRFFALWQQVCCIGCLSLVNQLLIALCEGGRGHFASLFIVISPAVMSMTLWLIIAFIIFRYQDSL